MLPLVSAVRWYFAILAVHKSWQQPEEILIVYVAGWKVVRIWYQKLQDLADPAQHLENAEGMMLSVMENEMIVISFYFVCMEQRGEVLYSSP